jgi:hypothetical protein
MQAGALLPYEQSLLRSTVLGLHTDDGRTLILDVERWLSPADAADQTVIDRCIAAMGLDIAETAVSLTRGQGLPAVLRSVFAPLPGEGRWPTVLLMDGNIGIGGDPARLLRRVRGLLAPGGRLLVEADPDVDADEQLTVRFAQGGRATGPAFGWARVGMAALRRTASTAGYTIDEDWSSGGRSFAALIR